MVDVEDQLLKRIAPVTDKTALQEVVDGYNELIKILPTPRPIIVTGQQLKPCGPPHLPHAEAGGIIFIDYPSNILSDRK